MIMRGPVTLWEFGAERGHPVSTPYEYLIGCDNELAQIHARYPEACDKVGGVIFMHINDLRTLAPVWLHKLKNHRVNYQYPSLINSTRSRQKCIQGSRGVVYTLTNAIDRLIYSDWFAISTTMDRFVGSV
jgi:hypothetical protein